MLDIKHMVIGHEEVLFELENIQIPLGSLVAIIGANGAGKSTFLNQFIGPCSSNNHISFNKLNWLTLNEKEKALYVTLVDNHFLGLPNLSTQEYLEFGRIPHTGLMGILADEDRVVLNSVIEKLSLQKLLNKPTHTLSDGERQRAGIARALVQETPLILLDEPTAFLDYPTKKEVLSLLAKIAQDEQKIILMSSHDLEFCLNFCTHFILIDSKRKPHFIAGELSFHDLIELTFS